MNPTFLIHYYTRYKASPCLWFSILNNLKWQIYYSSEHQASYICYNIFYQPFLLRLASVKINKGFYPRYFLFLVFYILLTVSDKNLFQNVPIPECFSGCSQPTIRRRASAGSNLLQRRRHFIPKQYQIPVIYI